MKKWIFTIACCLCFYTSFAQWEKLERDRTIENILVNKSMFEMMGKVAKSDDAGEKVYRELIKKLTELKVFKSKSSEKIGLMKSTMNEVVKSQNLKKLSEHKTAGEEVVFYVNEQANKSSITSMVMFMKNNTETTVMVLNGVFALEDLAVLTSKMNIYTNLKFNEL